MKTRFFGGIGGEISTFNSENCFPMLDASPRAAALWKRGGLLSWSWKHSLWLNSHLDGAIHKFLAY